MTRAGRGRFEKYFDEQSIRLDQSYKDGKTIISTAAMSGILKTLSILCKELQK